MKRRQSEQDLNGSKDDISWQSHSIHITSDKSMQLIPYPLPSPLPSLPLHTRATHRVTANPQHPCLSPRPPPGRLVPVGEGEVMECSHLWSVLLSLSEPAGLARVVSAGGGVEAAGWLGGIEGREGGWEGRG